MCLCLDLIFKLLPILPTARCLLLTATAPCLLSVSMFRGVINLRLFTSMPLQKLIHCRFIDFVLVSAVDGFFLPAFRIIDQFDIGPGFFCVLDGGNDIEVGQDDVNSGKIEKEKKEPRFILRTKNKLKRG